MIALPKPTLIFWLTFISLNLLDYLTTRYSLTYLAPIVFEAWTPVSFLTTTGSLLKLLALPLFVGACGLIVGRWFPGYLWAYTVTLLVIDVGYFYAVVHNTEIIWLASQLS